MQLLILAAGLLLITSCKNRTEISATLARESGSSLTEVEPSGSCPRVTRGPSQFSAAQVRSAVSNSDDIFVVELSASVQAGATNEVYKGYATQETGGLNPQEFRLNLNSSRASFTIFVKDGRIEIIRASGESTVDGFDCSSS